MRRQLSSHFCSGKVPPHVHTLVYTITFLLRHPAGIYPLECPFCRYVRALWVLGHSMFLVSDAPWHKWHKCAFSSLPMNASWVKSIVHVLFMPMHLSSVICVWRPNSGLSEIPLKLKQGVGTLSMKCFTLNVVSRLSPIWWLKLRAQSHQTLSKMLWLH